MSWPNGTRYKNAAAGGTWTPADMNAVQDQTLQVAGYRGVSDITTTETRTNTAYGLMTTPDRVTGIVLPADGLIAVAYQATWQESVAGAASAAIFIGTNQLKVAPTSPAGTPSPIAQAAQTGSTGSVAADAALTSWGGGLQSEGVDNANHYTGDVTTGQLVGLKAGGGPCFIFAAAGTYDVSVQFLASSGSVTVKNRKLWVWTLGFN